VANEFAGQCSFEMKDYQTAENYFLQSRNIYHALGKSQPEDRLNTIAFLLNLKLNPDLKNNSRTTADSIFKNLRNSGSLNPKHKVEAINDSKGIDQITLDNGQKIQQLSEEEIKARIKKDSMEVEQLKRDHALNDMNLTHEEDSIKDAQREQQIELLQGKISSANQALLQKQLQLSKVAQQKIWFLGGASIILLLTLFFYNRYRLKKKAFGDLEKAHDELKVIRDKLLEAEQFKDQFLANMSHEIRTPMNAIIGASNLVLNTKLDELQMKYMRAVKQSSANLLVIINDILDLS
jgi:signal transduction histidine kinase